MRRAIQLSVAMLTLLSAMAVVTNSASALALPENLPVEARTWTGTFGVHTLQIAEKEDGAPVSSVTCQTATAEGTEEKGKPLGLFHIKFNKCKSEGLACTGEKDAAEELLMLGTWHLVFDETGTTFEKLTTAMLFLFEEVKYKCTALISITLKAGGEILCLHLNPTVSSTKHEFHCLGSESKERWCKEDKENKCEGLTLPVLPVSINGGAAKFGYWLALGTITTPQEVFADV